MHKKLFLMTALLLGIVCPTLTLSADVDTHSCNHNRHRTGNTLPVIRLKSAISPFSENSAVAVISEIGLRDLRFNGTYGMGLNDNLRAKVSGEYLQQKLDYSFSTGRARRWMRQLAIGGDAQYQLCNCFVNDFHVRGYYSYSPSHRLDTVQCSAEGSVPGPRITRRITGSNAYGFLAGTSITPWNCGYLALNLNYDHVRYNRKFSHDTSRTGLGCGFDFRQVLTQTVSFGVKGEIRKPFNYIGANIDWNKAFCSGLFSVGIFANYTRGKTQLPNVTVAGVALGFNFARKNMYNYDDCCQQTCCQTYDLCDLVSYVQEPAVYLPVVLAIAEEGVCDGPVLAGSAIPNAVVPLGTIQTINLNDHFAAVNGGTISYNAIVAAVATVPGPSAALRAGFNQASGMLVNLNNSGILTLDNTRTSPHFPDALRAVQVTYQVTVRANSQCGTVTRTFLVTMPAA